MIVFSDIKQAQDACNDGGPSETYEQIRFRLDKVTELLCYTCQHLSDEQINAIKPFPKWWQEHQRVDRKRKEQEAAYLKQELQQAKADLVKASERVNKLTHRINDAKNN